MSRKIILDANVVDQINRGNRDAANALQLLRRSGADIYVSRQVYNELVESPGIPRVGAANREFLQDLGIEVAPTGALADRIDTVMNNDTRMGKVMSTEDIMTGAQAKAINAEVWSFDRVYRNNTANVIRMGIKVAPESTMIGMVQGRSFDYRTGRELMSLAPIEVGLMGQIRRPGPAGGASGAYSSNGYKASVGVPDMDLPEPGGPSARGQAIGNGILLVLEGINIVLNIVNDNIQRTKANEALDKVRSAIGQARAENPQLGVLILFYYTQVDPGPDSIIRPGAVFNYLLWGKGTTEDEAMEDIFRLPQVLPGTSGRVQEFSQKVWLPPVRKTQLTQARTPFPPLALGRFVMSKAKKITFQLVSFDLLEGFDDIVEKDLEIKSGANVDFVILEPPNEIRWLTLNAGMKSLKVPLKNAKTSNGETIPVVDLDTVSPFSAAAAMVFPLDDWAEEVFSYIQSTDDSSPNSVLRSYINFRMIRWVRAEDIELVRFIPKKR
jgi:predicted nucleic acid-binding protein